MAAALLGSVLLPASRLASATLINFDTLPHDTVVTTQYAGVELNAARIVRCSSDPSGCAGARSGQNALRPAIDFEFDNEPLVMLFDLLFGTYESPRADGPLAVGVADDRMPRGFWNQVISPFRRASR